jgi:predicted Rossmann fold flavoprotein
LILAGESYRDLAGVSADVRVSANGVAFRENILFTHRGMSGPAILQISNYWNKGEPVTIDLLPDLDATEVFSRERTSARHVGNFLADLMPARVAERLVRSRSGRTVASISDKEISGLASDLKNWTVRFNDTEGYDKAEVTLGGISTEELSSTTFETKKVPGLYFIGEVVDVTGWLGGYNFQWAWASGFAAAQAV